MITDETAHMLMAKKLAKETSSQEEAQLQDWLEAAADNKKAFNELNAIWQQVEKDTLEVDVDAAWQKVNNKTQTKVFTLFGATTYKIAAAAALFALLGFWAFNSLMSTTTTISTAANEIKKISLPDGSTVWLHEYSELSYNNKLKGSKRNLSLKGLAFFDVKRDEQRPFIISTPKSEVRVLGTSFEVNAFERDTFERVTVKTGKVKFENKSGEALELTANEEGIFTKSGNVTETVVNAEELVSWHTNKLTFNNETMDKVANKIARYYHVKVKFNNQDIANCHFTGSFENPKMNQVLDAISKALQITYVHQANHVTLSGQGCKKTLNK